MATMTANPTTVHDRKISGWLTIVGSLGMFIGAGFNLASGADADAALQSGDIGAYLVALEAGRTAALVNLAVWIVAICVLCAGGVLLASASNDGMARRLSIFGFTTGAGTAVMFFSLWMGVVLALAPAYAAGEPVEAVAHALLAGAVNADWVITVMIVVVGGGFLVFSGRDDWAPRWLIGWAWIAFAVGIVALLFVVLAMRAVAFAVVPVGRGMRIASGVTVIRRS